MPSNNNNIVHKYMYDSMDSISVLCTVAYYLHIIIHVDSTSIDEKGAFYALPYLFPILYIFSRTERSSAMRGKLTFVWDSRIARCC